VVVANLVLEKRHRWGKEMRVVAVRGRKERRRMCFWRRSMAGGGGGAGDSGGGRRADESQKNI
jgi:hypothetical protein